MRPLNLHSKSGLGLPWFMLIAVLAAAPLSAQTVILSAPRDPVLAPLLRAQNPPPPASTAPAPAEETPYRIGSIVIHPRLSYRYMNSDGMPLRGGTRANTEIHTVSAGFSADLSSHWSVDYSPSWIYYSVDTLSDSFEQSASLSGAYVLQDWSFQLTQGYSSSNQTLVETAQQTEQETWSSIFSAHYRFTEKTQLQSSVSLNTRDTEVGTNLRSWSVQTAIIHRISPRLSLNLSPAYTYTEIAEGADTYGENYTAGLNWQPSDKITVAASGGIRNSHSKSLTGRNTSSPLLNVSLGYRPVETTTVSLAVSRSVAPSYFKDQETENYRWNLSVNQRLLGRFYLTAGYGRQDTNYVTLAANGPSARNDLVESYTFGLSTRLFSRISVSANLQENKNTSDAAGFSFSSKQYGIALSWEL